MGSGRVCLDQHVPMVDPELAVEFYQVQALPMIGIQAAQDSVYTGNVFGGDTLGQGREGPVLTVRLGMVEMEASLVQHGLPSAGPVFVHV